MSAKTVPIPVYPDFLCSFSAEHLWRESRQHRRKHSGNMPWSLCCATDSNLLTPHGVACSYMRQSSATTALCSSLFCPLFRWQVATRMMSFPQGSRSNSISCVHVWSSYVSLKKSTTSLHWHPLWLAKLVEWVGYMRAVIMYSNYTLSNNVSGYLSFCHKFSDRRIFKAQRKQQEPCPHLYVT